MALSLLLVGLATSCLAQQIGKLTAEVHPPFRSERCTVEAGCTAQNTSIVLDSDYRWTHTVNGYDNCKPDGLDTALCPDAKTCSANCALEGVNYTSYGIDASDRSLTLKLFTDENGVTKMSSPRVYLLNEHSEYETFSMLNKEISFTVDVSKLPCGTNGALYFSEMLADGGRSDLNPAGASYGTGYCDAQCPTPAFINGEANIEKHGACCNEMDLWEANSKAQALTPHPCNITQVYKCSGAACGTGNKYASVCDKDGCDFNPYRLGQTRFYQPNATVDTTRPFTVVTQFLTTNGTDQGDLKEIRRLYVQDGRIIDNAVVSAAGFNRENSLTDAFCAKEKQVFGGVNAFANQGGLRGMGEALRRGMVLVFSIWDDAGSAMKWLDGTFPTDADVKTQPGTGRGPCAANEGSAQSIKEKSPWVQVTFSQVKSGEIGSTFGPKGVKGLVPRIRGGALPRSLKPLFLNTTTVNIRPTAPQIPTTRRPAPTGSSRPTASRSTSRSLTIPIPTLSLPTAYPTNRQARTKWSQPTDNDPITNPHTNGSDETYKDSSETQRHKQAYTTLEYPDNKNRN
ncbi:uncharacterized protein JN550_013772 [Neoarthrinium moseri]|uniref:uncharacterized protein n=1 Tax=Neoarthrinium moseri TaxID=1658444 RepID=UPI001FDBECC6|nr:uncharacterized protein JN550_013772 [Neoarthrinium moseri]KAI1856510.1 hypothetical protein JN550_013772 [Neoarthrinium moseri]